MSMSHEWESVSAYFDGELDGLSAEDIRRLIKDDPEAAETLKRYGRLHSSLQRAEGSDSQIDVDASAGRTWHRIQARIGAFADYDPAMLPDARHHDRRVVSLPLPLAAAATLLLIASFTMAVWLAARQTPVGPPNVAAGSGPVNVTIEVDDMTADQLVQWLHQEDMLGELTVNLPPTPEFRMMGEPALIKVSDQRPAVERAP
ncbi:MAG: hypothetical protein ACOCYG_02765 [Spirochaetota bacterium]